MQRIRAGQFPMTIEAVTDSYSIFSYLAAAHLKLPAEKSTFYHLAYLREKLECGLIHSYNWVDTRDMIVDGLTKGGSADRSALSAIMDGRYKLQHAGHEYREPRSSSAGLARFLFASIKSCSATALPFFMSSSRLLSPALRTREAQRC